MEQNGVVDPQIRLRVRESVRLWRNGLAPRVIMSGRSGLAAPDPPTARTEARAMAAYARTLGLPRPAILTENFSRDTIGNAYFTKTSLLEPHGWRNLVIVTSDYHVLRSRYIFKKILGPRYRFKMHSAPSLFTNLQLDSRMAKEHGLYELARRLLDQVLDGDDAEIGYRLMTRHPVYALRKTALSQGWLHLAKRVLQ